MTTLTPFFVPTIKNAIYKNKKTWKTIIVIVFPSFILSSIIQPSIVLDAILIVVHRAAGIDESHLH